MNSGEDEELSAKEIAAMGEQLMQIWRGVVGRITDESVRAVYKQPEGDSPIVQFAHAITNPTIEVMRSGAAEDGGKYAANVLAFHRFTVDGFEPPLFGVYTGFTPSLFDIAFPLIELGTILDFAVPRGLLVTDELSLTRPYNVIPLENVGDIGRPMDNPLLSLMRREIDQRKKSELFEDFGELMRETEVRFLFTKFSVEKPKWILALPRNGHTILVVHSVCWGLGAVSEKVNLFGRSQKFRIIPPKTRTIYDCANVLRKMAYIASNTRTDADISSRFPAVDKKYFEGTILGQYLASEAKRMQEDPERTPATLKEFVGTAHVGMIRKQMPARDRVMVHEQKEERGPVLFTAECPHCGQTGEYDTDVIRTFGGLVRCKNCGERFKVAQ
jgi:predicted Zn finger-like uncharacterized protein